MSLILSAAAGGGGNNYVLKNSTQAQTYTSPSFDTTGANLMIAACGSYGGYASFSDNKSNAYSLALQNGSGSNTTLDYSRGGTFGTGHILSLSGGGYQSIAAAAFSGAPATPLDQSNSFATSGVASIQAGSITPTQNNELIIAVLGPDNNAGTVTINSGFTIITSAPYVNGVCMGIWIAYLLQTTAAAVNPTWTMTAGNNPTALIASFKAT
jgi:hypothetical protein